MARLSIIICDLCKSMSKVTLPFCITLQSGKGKTKEVKKADICQGCYDNLYKKIEHDFEFNNSFLPQPKVEKVDIAEGESIVPSNLNNIVPPPRPSCLHDRTSFEPPNDIKCKDCGEEWKAEL